MGKLRSTPIAQSHKVIKVNRTINERFWEKILMFQLLTLNPVHLSSLSYLCWGRRQYTTVLELPPAQPVAVTWVADGWNNLGSCWHHNNQRCQGSFSAVPGIPVMWRHKANVSFPVVSEVDWVSLLMIDHYTEQYTKVGSYKTPCHSAFFYLHI